MTRDDIQRLLSYAPELATAPGVVVGLTTAPGDKRQNAQGMARTIGAANFNKAVTEYTDDNDSNALDHALGFLHSGIKKIGSGLSWVQQHSFAAQQSGEFGKTDKQIAAQQRKQQRQQQQLGAVAVPPRTLPQVLGGIAAGANGAVTGRALNAGLAEAQHQYRALSDIQRTHGTAAAVLETALAMGGAAGGALAGGVPGAALGAEATLGVTERTLYPESWAATADGEAYRDASGNLVSPGRDFANKFHLKDGSIPYNVLTGVVDGVFDLAADPVAQGAALVKGANATEKAAGGLLGSLRGDTVIRDTETIESIVQRRPGVRSVFDDMAGKSAAEIQRDYPRFGTLAKDLGDARSVEGVARVFEDARTQATILGEALPTIPKPFSGRTQTSAELAAHADNIDPASRLQLFERRLKSKLPQIYDPETGGFSATKLDPESASASSLEAVRRTFKFGGLNDRVIDGVMQQYIEATPANRRIILRNTWIRGFIAQTKRVDPGEDEALIREVTAKMKVTFDNLVGGTGGMDGADYGFDVFGHSTSPLGDRATAAIYTSQRGGVTLPLHADWIRAVREEAGGARALYGRLDDFAYDHITRHFKQLALATMGFAARIGILAEGVPAAFHEGLINTIRAGATARNTRRLMGTLLPDEEEGLAEFAANLLYDGRAVVQDDRLVKDAVDLAIAQHGDILPPALGHNHWDTEPTLGPKRKAKITLHGVVQDSPNKIETARFTGYRSGDEEFPKVWSRSLREASKDEGARIHAAAYRDAYISAGRERVEAGRAGGFVETTSRDAADEVRALPAADTSTAVTETGAIEPAVAETAAAGGRTAKYTDDELVKIATDAAVKADEAWLRDPANADIVGDMMRSQKAHFVDQDPIHQWAIDRVETTKGLTHYVTRDRTGQQLATPHLQLLDSVATGKIPRIPDLADIDIANRPLAVKGRIRIDDRAGNWVDKLADVGFRRLVDPTIRTFGREHQFLLEYSKARRAFDGAVEHGLLSEDEALYKARELATHRVARFIHNPFERTQTATLLRNFSPFYFAQEQSYRRLGRLLATDPAAFRRYQLAVLGMSDFIQRQTDAEGQTHLIIPGAGFMDELLVNAFAKLGLPPVAAAAPTAIVGSVSSLESVMPFTEIGSGVEGLRPSASVFVTMAGRGVQALFPETKQYVEKVVGPIASSGAVWEQLVPNTALRNALKSVGGGSVDSAMIATVQSLQYQQNVAMSKWQANGGDPLSPDAPHIVPGPNAGAPELKEFQEKVRNQARITLFFKAILSEFTPVAPQVKIGDYGVSQEAQKLIDKYGIIEGTARLLEKNPNATPYTVFGTTQTGVPVQPYRVSQHYVDKNKALFRDYPMAAGYLIPQVEDGEFDSAVYQEQLGLGLRERKGYDQFVNDMWINEGFAQYEADNAIHQAELVRLGADRVAVKTENAAWAAYKSDVLAKQNPVWWTYFTSPDRDERRKNELDQLRVVVEDPRTPKTEQVKGIRGLLADLDAHLNSLEVAKRNGWSREQRDTLTDGWESYLKEVSDANPQLALVTSRLFKYVGTQ